MKRQVSGPALELINRADLRPAQIDDALQLLARQAAPVVLRNFHPIVQHIGQASDINVVRIARRSRCLLIEIEQPEGDGPAWQYRERTPGNCIFSCRAQIAATIEVALTNQLLACLVVSTTALGQARIKQATQTADGWIDVEVEPEWHRF